MTLPQITMIGNVVAAPELRFTASGKAIGKVRLACNSRRKNAQGGWEDGETCFLDVTAWEKLAEALCEVDKGAKLMVVGRLSQRTYETQAGEKRVAYEVTAEEIGKLLAMPKGQPGPRPAQSDDPWGAAPAPAAADPWGTPANLREDPPF